MTREESNGEGMSVASYVKSFDLVTYRLRCCSEVTTPVAPVLSPLRAWLHSDSGQVVCTILLLSRSSIGCYWLAGDILSPRAVVINVHRENQGQRSVGSKPGLATNARMDGHDNRINLPVIGNNWVQILSIVKGKVAHNRLPSVGFRS